MYKKILNLYEFGIAIFKNMFVHLKKRLKTNIFVLKAICYFKN